MKRYVAWVCTHSRKGRSRDIQEAAMRRYAERHNGTIVRLWRTSGPAEGFDHRVARELLLAYVKKNAADLDGILFYRLDRAARTLSELKELVRLEVERGVRLIFVAEPYENKAAARLERRFLTGLLDAFSGPAHEETRDSDSR
jgi:DNA invertase Pin-like site-specific DNA recombinase